MAQGEALFSGIEMMELKSSEALPVAADGAAASCLLQQDALDVAAPAYDSLSSAFRTSIPTPGATLEGRYAVPRAAKLELRLQLC
jgi:hypothetical protein